jgi:DNA-binding NtrC family response regulator
MSDLIFHDIVGRSRQIRRVIKRIRDVAPLDVPVLISGESGVGKELVARAIHDESTRRRGPFQAVNSGAVPNDLVASELFGHEKGAFTGATSAHPGFFESAKGGTLFLDEIATMGEEMQISLLRVLETSRYLRVGGSGSMEADVRVIAATNERVKRGRETPSIRKDLFYRLSVFTIAIPPLRERRDDIPVLVHHFLAQLGRRLGRRVSSVEPAAMRQLKSYGWPGNVRELINVISRVIISSENETVTEAAVVDALYAAPGWPTEPTAESVRSSAPAEDSRAGGSQPYMRESETAASEAAEGDRDPNAVVLQAGQTIEDAERELIRLTLEHVHGNRTRAAKLLGISRKSLYNKVKLYELEV